MSFIKILQNGDKHYLENNKLVKIEYIDGGESYYLNGVLHREDGPSQICSEGLKFWFKNGVLTRHDGPAIESPTYKEWYKNGIIHREGLPAVEMIDGTKKWYENGILHKEKGPAVYNENTSHFSYYYNGMLHRIDGPAIVTYYSTEWWFLGKMYTEKEHKKIYMLVNKFIRKLKNKLKNKAKNMLYEDIKFPKDLSTLISNYLY
jgi:hypothetical protein